MNSDILNKNHFHKEVNVVAPPIILTLLAELLLLYWGVFGVLDPKPRTACWVSLWFPPPGSCYSVFLNGDAAQHALATERIATAHTAWCLSSAFWATALDTCCPRTPMRKDLMTPGISRPRNHRRTAILLT